MEKKNVVATRRKKTRVTGKKKITPRRASVSKSTRRATIRKNSGRSIPRKSKEKPKRRRTTATIRFSRKRTYQQTRDLAREVISFKTTKGSRKTATRENVQEALEKQLKKAKKRFSRKRSDRFTATIKVRYKNSKGKWVKKNIVAVSEDLERAVELLMQDETIYDDTSPKYDRFGNVISTRKIKSSTKKITGVTFSKYVQRKRKLPKATKARKKGKTSRDVRRRK